MITDLDVGSLVYSRVSFSNMNNCPFQYHEWLVIRCPFSIMTAHVLAVSWLHWLLMCHVTAHLCPFWYHGCSWCPFQHYDWSQVLFQHHGVLFRVTVDKSFSASWLFMCPFQHHGVLFSVTVDKSFSASWLFMCPFQHHGVLFSVTVDKFFSASWLFMCPFQHHGILFSVTVDKSFSASWLVMCLLLISPFQHQDCSCILFSIMFFSV